MPAKPPLLPSAVLARVLKISLFEGRTVLWLSGTFALLSAIQHDVIGAVAGVAAAGAGALEIHGNTELRNGNPQGVGWLVRSQLLLMGVILIYAALRIAALTPAVLQERVTPQLEEQLAEIGMAKDAFLQMALRVFQFGYVLTGVLTVIYQGAMSWYYYRRRDPIRQALEEEMGADVGS